MNRDKLALLVLARAAVKAAKPPKRAAIAKAVGPLIDSGAAGGALDALIDEAAARLRERGELEDGRFVPTEAGRARLRSVFGFDTTPRWDTFRRTQLAAVSLDLAPEATAVRKRLATDDGLFGMVLAAHHDLPIGDTPTLNQAVDALVWRQLGVETAERLTLAKIRALLVGRALGGDEPVASAKAGRIAASVAAGARGTRKDALATALARRWLAGPAGGARPEPPPQAPSLTDDRFAALVRESADRAPGSARFGERKVFISAVWRSARVELEAAGIDEAEFKRRLVDANRGGRVRLHRADLVGAMDPAEVAASEVRHLTAVYHFVEGGAGNE